MKRVIDLRNWRLAEDDKERKEKKSFSSIQDYALYLIKSTSLDNNTIAEKVKVKFHSKTSSACIAWYRNKLKKGELK